MIAAEHLADIFVTVADTLVDDFDLVDFLHLLTDHAAVISSADAVGLVLADRRGALQFMAASNESGKALELFQLQSDEGPCRDCFTTGDPVVNADLAAAVERWPTFGPQALAAGFVAVHAFPMRLREETIGALNLFNREPQEVDDDLARVVQALADVATIAILQQRTVSRAEALAEQMQGALQSRTVIEQAKGALAQAEGISVDEAFTRMRRRARDSRRRLLEVAGEVLERHQRPRG